MQVFNLTEALAGAPLCLANGVPVTKFILNDATHPFPYKAYVGGYISMRYNSAGQWNMPDGRHKYYDLWMVEEDIIDASI